ncbi:MAG: hypothetical protein WEB30_05390 [Cyclobacteriaceae bacterium]
MIRILTLSVLSLLSSAVAFPQSHGDTTFVSAVKENTISLYKQALRAQSRLNNGSKYRATGHSLEQHPYFLSEDWIAGSVFYDGEFFGDVFLMYDLNQGVLVTEHYPSGNSIELVDQKLRNFTLQGHYFERIDIESVANSLPKTDFYDILYGGESKVVAHRQKLLRREIESGTIEISYDEKYRYFIFRNGVFFPVKSKGSALKVMSDKKQELKRFHKQNRASFFKNRELMLKRLAEYYDSL